MFVFVCVISNQSASEKHVSDFNKLDALLSKTHQGPSGTKVLQGSTWADPLSKILQQMWCDHPLS